MNGNGRAQAGWGLATQGAAHPMLLVALQSLRREGIEPASLAACKGEPCRWMRRIAECLVRGECGGAIVFCDDVGLACCVANKVPGVRAAAVASIPQARQALDRLGANFLTVEQAGRTFYEFKQILRLCCSQPAVCCPPGIACVLQELDGHAHR
jgi:hypothetical protein